ncbi:MAG TPA: glycosyltransferase family 4 protein [Anaerolineaceae bacterium]|nr:glycosyltransferase family 4 protein [Anaerolineaceae bacterium]
MKTIRTAILHYSAPPVIGGVEAVIQSHADAFLRNGYPVAVIAGRGSPEGLPKEAEFIQIPRLDSLHPDILDVSEALESGVVPDRFNEVTARLVEDLRPIVTGFDTLIVHNVFTKHFNLPLTAALFQLIDEGAVRHCIAWCHDLSWTSPNSRSKLSGGLPWDLLRTYREDVTYVAISEARKREMLSLFQCPPDRIHVVYNGVDPQTLLGLSDSGFRLVNRLGLLESDLNLLMPVRVTRAKNIEYALNLTAALKATGLRPRLVLTGPPDPHDESSVHYFQELLDLRKRLDVVEEFRFVYESGENSSEPMYIDQTAVGELFRVADFLFMPSHREGFGMPVLEAGLIGVPVISTAVPAAVEIGEENVLTFSPATSAEYLADQILIWIQDNPVFQLRRKVRQNYTWQAIFDRRIEPLLVREPSP